MVTVVVITRDRARDLERALARLEALPERPHVIVVDNASSDATPDVISVSGVEAVRLHHNAGAAARNIGVERAATALVAFCDDDSCWEPGALARAERILAKYTRMGLLAARVLVGEKRKVDPVCMQMAASPLPRAIDLPGPSVLGFLACGAIVRRDAFLAAGGFHERLGVGGEETLLAIDLARRGWGLAYCADVVAHHYPASLASRPGRQARIVRNALWTAWLRYRAGEAMSVTWGAVSKARHDATVRSGMKAALAGLPWVLRHRTAVDRPLQRLLAQIELAA